MDKTFLDQAWPLWRAGQLIDAGHLLFESMPEQDQPRWAIRLLKFAVARSGISSAPVENLLRIADDPARWGEAHDAFRQLRRAGLALDRQNLTDEQHLLLRLLCVGEITAKVVYNASGFPAPFDHDAGWWVASIFAHFLDRTGDATEQAWVMLCGQEQSI